MHHSITLPQLIPLIDLTRLTENDREEAIRELCELAQTPYGNVAAVCIYDNFIGLAKKCLINTPIKIATVANFPGGNKTLEACIKDINTSIGEGADEMDIVFPYQHFLAGKIDGVCEFLQTCKNTCGENIILKVILETGALLRPDVIAHATDIAILAGADFIKTSTGKISIGATLQAADTILNVIKKYPEKKVGLKLSGGIQTVAQAMEYIQLVERSMGTHWISPRTLRFGTSRLLNDILLKLG